MEEGLMEGTHKDGAADVTMVIDAAPIGWFIVSIVVQCSAVALLDGFDTLAISYLASVIAGAWKLPEEAFGPIFSAHYIGAAIGAGLWLACRSMGPTSRHHRIDHAVRCFRAVALTKDLHLFQLVLVSGQELAS
jgi:hypothetical protein